MMFFVYKKPERTNAYRKISLYGTEIPTKLDPYQEVSLHMAPDTEKATIEVRLWWNK